MRRWLPHGALWFSLAVIAVVGVTVGRQFWPRPRPAAVILAPEPPPPPPPVTELAMFRGNPARSLSAVGAVPRRPKLLWRFCTRTKYEGAYEQRGSAKLSASSPWRGLGWTGQPTRVGERLYFGSSDSYVYCLDAVSGQVQWYYPTHHCVKGSISVFGDRIYHGGRDNKIHCYSLNGEMLWETRTGNDMDSNPVIVDGRGYIGGEDQHVYCFDPDTGRILWQSATTAGSVESSPCVVNGRVYAGSGQGILYCLDAETGATIWCFRTLGDTDSTPVYHDGAIYVGSATGDVGEQGH
ncbi:MAG TPA: PQQ-binding-like beta-propeller repeat protein, partial [Armatimonadota bacterium]|nr:PQQ-binding-like beta-propeller repeat protein [Armatimonadota bacterium]